MKVATQSIQQRPRRRRFRRFVASFLITSAILLLGAFFGLRWFESAVTFHPERYSPGPAWNLPPNGEEVWIETADRVQLYGWYLHADGHEDRPPAIVYFHGNGGNLSDVAWIGKSLARRGFDVLLFDYRGYGRSDGSTGDEKTLNLDADAAYGYVISRGLPPDKIALYGQSLGTTTAVDLAWRRGCGALVLESGLSSASDLASVMLPSLPRWLHRIGRNRFESARKLTEIHCPVLITHGEPDDTIPTEEGRALYASANEPKRLMILKGAGHNVAGTGGDEYLDSVARFVRETMRGE
jgi:pimeloyl-ACP methyl ester carboxylesterase